MSAKTKAREAARKKQQSRISQRVNRLLNTPDKSSSSEEASSESSDIPSPPKPDLCLNFLTKDCNIIEQVIGDIRASFAIVLLGQTLRYVFGPKMSIAAVMNLPPMQANFLQAKSSPSPVVRLIRLCYSGFSISRIFAYFISLLIQVASTFGALLFIREVPPRLGKIVDVPYLTMPFSGPPSIQPNITIPYDQILCQNGLCLGTLAARNHTEAAFVNELLASTLFLTILLTLPGVLQRKGLPIPLVLLPCLPLFATFKSTGPAMNPASTLAYNIFDILIVKKKGIDAVIRWCTDEHVAVYFVAPFLGGLLALPFISIFHYLFTPKLKPAKQKKE